MGACQLADIVWDAVHAVQPAMDARKHHLTVHSPLAPVTGWDRTRRQSSLPSIPGICQSVAMSRGTSRCNFWSASGPDSAITT